MVSQNLERALQDVKASNLDERQQLLAMLQFAESDARHETAMLHGKARATWAEGMRN